MGAFKAAKELNIELTFEGPEGDFAVDKQLDMLATAIDKKPAAIIICEIVCNDWYVIIYDADLRLPITVRGFAKWRKIEAKTFDLDDT